jgi:hypothetical protein
MRVCVCLLSTEVLGLVYIAPSMPSPNRFGDCGLRRELGTSVTAVRVVRIHLVDGDEVYQHIYRQER